MKLKSNIFFIIFSFGIVFNLILFPNTFAQSAKSSNLEWQKKYNFAETKEKFAEPPLFYAPHAFWFWDAPLDTVQNASMAREMTKQRMNPGYVHPRHAEAPLTAFPGLPREEWLSPLWFQSIESAAREAGSAGMTLGYCDEY